MSHTIIYAFFNTPGNSRTKLKLRLPMKLVDIPAQDYGYWTNQARNAVKQTCGLTHAQLQNFRVMMVHSDERIPA